jgi:hypothetical protein
MMTVHERFGRDAACSCGGLSNPLDVVRSERQRFFAQHMLAGFERANRPVGVQAVRQRNVNRIDLRIAQERFIRGQCSRDIPLRGVLTCTLDGPAGDSDERISRRRLQGGNDRAIDAGGAKETPAQIAHRHHALLEPDNAVTH